MVARLHDGPACLRVRAQDAAAPPGIATANYTKPESAGGSASLTARLSKWESGGHVINSALIGDGPHQQGSSFSAASKMSSWRAPENSSSSSSSSKPFEPSR